MSATLVSNRFAFNRQEEGTSEHSLELVRVFETARLFQFRDHARLGLVRCRYAVDETLGQLGRIERLKNVFLLEVLEDDHL
jgi:hypothetical protein